MTTHRSDMCYFDKDALAERYGKFRPDVHHQVIDLVHELIGSQVTYGCALDVGCGTGQSTLPLAERYLKVIGCDVSEEMLHRASKHERVEYVLSPAENLMIKSSFVDLITVGFAFHWFNQVKFIKEAERVLKPGGWLCVYNLNFPGIMIGRDDYRRWHRGVYWQRYPNPPRISKKLNELIAEVDQPGWEYFGERELKFIISFEKFHLARYLTTQTNISVALDKGESLSEIDNWLLEELDNYFEGQEGKFVYQGEFRLCRKSHKLLQRQ